APRLAARHAAEPSGVAIDLTPTRSVSEETAFPSLTLRVGVTSPHVQYRPPRCLPLAAAAPRRARAGAAPLTLPPARASALPASRRGRAPPSPPPPPRSARGSCAPAGPRTAGPAAGRK